MTVGCLSTSALRALRMRQIPPVIKAKTMKMPPPAPITTGKELEERELPEGELVVELLGDKDVVEDELA